MMTASVEDMLKLYVLDKKNKLEEIFTFEEGMRFMDVQDTMNAIIYKNGDDITFFSDKYKDWVRADVVQAISNDVIYIECELPTKERSTPIFVFKEVLESLDKEIFGDTIQEIETSGYFFQLFKVVAFGP